MSLLDGEKGTIMMHITQNQFTALGMVLVVVILSGCFSHYGETDLCNPRFYIRENALYFQKFNDEYLEGNFSFTFTPNTCTGAEVPQASASYQVKIGMPVPNNIGFYLYDSVPWLTITNQSGIITPQGLVTVYVKMSANINPMADGWFLFIEGDAVSGEERELVSITPELPLIVEGISVEGENGNVEGETRIEGENIDVEGEILIEHELSNTQGNWEYAEFQYRLDNQCGYLVRISLYSADNAIIDEHTNYEEWDPWGRGYNCTAIICHARLPWQQLPEGWWLRISIMTSANACDEQVDCCNANCGEQSCVEQMDPCINNVPGSLIIAIINGERYELTWPEVLDCSSKNSFYEDGYFVNSYSVSSEMLCAKN